MIQPSVLRIQPNILRNSLFSVVRNASTSSSGRRKKRITSFRTNLRQFLGPKNFKGLYTKNPFFWASKNHETNYITKYSLRGGNINWQKVFQGSRERGSDLKPFNQNEFCKSALLIPSSLKKTFVSQVNSGKSTIQQLAFKYGLSIPRIEAILKLDKIEKQMKNSVSNICIFLIECFPLHFEMMSHNFLYYISISLEDAFATA